jgi:transcriptional regulator with XRE-family HTH domain
MYGEIFKFRLKYAREQKGYSQVFIADSIHIGQSTYANYEIGRRIPDLEKLGMLADTLDVSVDWLIGREKPQQFKQ